MCWAPGNRAILCRQVSGSSSSLGVDVMSKKNRSFLLVSLVPAFLLGGVFAVVQAQNAGSPAKPTNWSDPATWPNKKVPAAGDKVEIASGKEVILDVSPPALNGLTINGKLTSQTIRPGTDHRVDHGARGTGRSAPKPSPPRTRPPSPSPTTSKTKTVWMGMGDRGIMLSGGTLNLHGNRHQHLDQAGRARPKPAATRSRC